MAVVAWASGCPSECARRPSKAQRPIDQSADISRQGFTPQRSRCCRWPTNRGYESLPRSTTLPTFGRSRLRDLEQPAVRGWAASLSRRGLSPSRERQSYRLLSHLCDAAVIAGVLHSDPCVGVTLPRLPDVEPTILTPAQVQPLAEQMRPPYGLLTRTLAYTGVRFGEAAGSGVEQGVDGGCEHMANQVR